VSRPFGAAEDAAHRRGAAVWSRGGSARGWLEELRREAEGRARLTRLGERRREQRARAAREDAARSRGGYARRLEEQRRDTEEVARRLGERRRDATESPRWATAQR
jgi:hypothetical protein